VALPAPYCRVLNRRWRDEIDLGFGNANLRPVIRGDANFALAGRPVITPASAGRMANLVTEHESVTRPRRPLVDRWDPCGTEPFCSKAWGLRVPLIPLVGECTSCEPGPRASRHGWFHAGAQGATRSDPYEGTSGRLRHHRIRLRMRRQRRRYGRIYASW